MPAQPLIIEAAVNGATSKASNPAVPRSDEEIVREALACFDAGASIVHCHLDNERLDLGETVARYGAIFSRVLAVRPDALIYPTWRAFERAEERHAHAPALAARGLARLSYLDAGSVNVASGLDEAGLPAGSRVYLNTFDDCRYAIDLAARNSLGLMIAIFEPGFLRLVLAYERAGRLPSGAFVRLYFGGDYDVLTGAPTPVSFGMPPTLPCLDAYLSMLAGSRLPWAVAVLGGDAVNSDAGRAAIERGGHLRVGLEDFGGSGRPTNVELIGDAISIAARSGRRAASSLEAARILGLPRRAITA